MGKCGYLFEIEGDIYEERLPLWISFEELSRRLDEKALGTVWWCWERVSDGKYVIEKGSDAFELRLPEGLSDKAAEELIKREILKRIDRRVLNGGEEL